MKDMVNSIGVVEAIAPAAYTATFNGTSVDLNGFNGVLFAINTGVVTDGTYDITIEESDDNAAWNAVDSKEVIGANPAITDSDDNATYKIGYVGIKQYVRLVVTVAGATTGALLSAAAVKGFPRHAPVS